jgi:hypothetical protein
MPEITDNEMVLVPREALEPFLRFIDGAKFLPDAAILTNGSPLARNQLRASDFRRLAAAVAEVPLGGGNSSSRTSPAGDGSLPVPSAVAALTCDFQRGLPGGALDDSDYEAIESALDAIDAPMTDRGRWLSLVERVRAVRKSEVLENVTASLAAAISLLERSPKTAAPSDKMFDQMLADYRASLGRARAALSDGVGRAPRPTGSEAQAEHRDEPENPTQAEVQRR